MKHKLILFSLVALLCSCGESEQAAAEEPTLSEPDYELVQRMIQEEINKNLDATREKDIDAYMDLIPEDFLVYDESGEVITRDMQRTYILRDWAIIDTTLKISMVVDSMKQLTQDSVLVYTSQDWERLMFQRDGVTKDTVRTTQVHLETWRLTPRGWMAFDIVELGGKVFINGEASDPEQN